MTIDRLLAHLPQVLGAIALLLIGWLLARLLRMATRRAAGLLDSLITRSTGQARWKIGRSASLVGTIVYWVVLLFFITAATHTLGLQSFSDWLARLLDHLPTLAAGLLIVFAGYLLSGFVGEIVLATASGLAPPQRQALARVAKWATLILALLIGADQIGLKVTWLAIFAAVLVGSILGGLALSVSLGARHYVANLIGAHHLRQALRIGQRVRVAGHEGRIVDLSATSLILETDDGRVMLPGSVYHGEAIVVVVRDGQPNGD
ncbi:mechanosensitive ion channel family protein [Piscinibacter sakaiensis]|uniref:mechanosensitive ion channel family protein n=1 Tax=Piscinibacter sakaiensis TaxID=1547922 RepID=UPI003AAFE015